MTLFPASRSLLYPQFETYRLQSLDQDDAVSSYPLPSHATQSRVGYATSQHLLSFKEVRSRIAWDHLAIGDGGRGIYVDVDMGMVGFVIDEDYKPTFTSLGSLPQAIGSSSTSQHPEYPSARELDATHWAVSSGSGSLYILETTSPADATFTGSIIAKYDLQVDSHPEPSPFLIQAAHAISPTENRLLLSRSVPAAPKEKGRAQTAVFEMLEVVIDPTWRNEVDEGFSESLEISWRLQGGDLPVWTARHGEGWIVLAGETYSVIPDSHDATSSSDVLGGAAVGEDAETAGDPSQEREWPYSWTQDAESINMKFQFTPSILRTNISVSLKSDSLSISINNGTEDLSSVLSNFLVTPLHTFWAEIDVSESTWTFDAGTSLLEFDLIKVDENTRWPFVFAPRDGEDGEDEQRIEEVEVPETLSPELLASVRATFDNIRTRQPGEPEGSHSTLPGLIREEMDFEFEGDEDGEDGVFGDVGGGGKVGRDVFVGYLRDGKGTWAKGLNSVVSIPISGQREEGIVVKSGVDGLLFSPNNDGDPTRYPWKHSSSSPALSFVLSSKRDLRLVRHISNESGKTTVLAFESGASVGAGNVYVYYPPTSSTVAGQGVVNVCGGERGALLGVGCVSVAGQQVVLALCEKELVVLHGIL